MDIRQIALDTLKAGAPGLSAQTIEVLAGIIARKAAAGAHKPSQGYGAGRDQDSRVWNLYAVGGDTMGIGLTAANDAACDLALSALRTQRLIEALRTDEGDCVTIYSDNPEAIDADHRMAVDCNGAWTDWIARRFNGATVLQCLTKAVRAREEAARG